MNEDEDMEKPLEFIDHFVETTLHFLRNETEKHQCLMLYNYCFVFFFYFLISYPFYQPLLLK